MIEISKHQINLCFNKYNKDYITLDELILSGEEIAARNNHQHGYGYNLISPYNQNQYIRNVNLIVNIINKLNIDNGKVLDWGGGDGMNTYLLRNASVNTTFYDIQKRDFEGVLKSIKDEKYVIGDHAYMLPFNDFSYNLVASFGVLEHVPYPHKSLQEINRVLTRGGIFYCCHLPNTFSYINFILTKFKGYTYHDVFYHRRKTRIMLEKSGFKIIKIWNQGLFPKLFLFLSLSKRQKIYQTFPLLETLDRFLCRIPFLKHLSTNLSFIAIKVN